MNPRVSRADQVVHTWPTERSRRWVLKFLHEAERDPNIVAVVAVGSSVRPGVPSYDLDLVVVCRKRSELRQKAPLEIVLRTFDLDKIESALEKGVGKGQDLLAWAVRFGEPLYEFEGAWSGIVDRWHDALPLPDPEEAIRRAAVAKDHLENMETAGDREAALELRVSYLTHLARAMLSAAGIFPASRPELPDQLRRLCRHELAQQLEVALLERERISAETTASGQRAEAT